MLPEPLCPGLPVFPPIPRSVKQQRQLRGGSFQKSRISSVLCEVCGLSLPTRAVLAHCSCWLFLLLCNCLLTSILCHSTTHYPQYSQHNHSKSCVWPQPSLAESSLETYWCRSPTPFPRSDLILSTPTPQLHANCASLIAPSPHLTDPDVTSAIESMFRICSPTPPHTGNCYPR